MIIYKDKIERHFVREHPDAYFVFGDNDQRTGFGGQAAAMRGEMNAIGIPTKKRPSMLPNAFYTDDEFVENCAKMDSILILIDVLLEDGANVYMPSRGFGTGLAQLHARAPKTFDWLNTRIKELESEHGFTREA